MSSSQGDYQKYENETIENSDSDSYSDFVPPPPNTPAPLRIRGPNGVLIRQEQIVYSGIKRSPVKPTGNFEKILIMQFEEESIINLEKDISTHIKEGETYIARLAIKIMEQRMNTAEEKFDEYQIDLILFLVRKIGHQWFEIARIVGKHSSLCEDCWWTFKNKKPTHFFSKSELRDKGISISALKEKRMPGQ